MKKSLISLILVFILVNSLDLAWAGKPAFELAMPGEQGIIDYEKYGYFMHKGKSKYRYVVTDEPGLIKAVGEGIYPAIDYVKRDPAFRKYQQNRELLGSHWDFLQDENLQRAFFKWAVANDDPGIKLLYIGGILEKAGHYRQALKAYYALIIHFPFTVGWAPSGDWFWLAAPGALNGIKKICKKHPELGMKLEGAEVFIERKEGARVTENKFIKSEWEIRIDPGKWVKSDAKAPVRDKTIVGHVPSKKARVHFAKHKDGSATLYVDKKPYYIKGAGGTEFMPSVAAHGGNTVRTWGHKDPQEAVQVLDAAQKQGLMVCLGLWIDHERHGFNYDDPAQVEKRYKHFISIVDAVKDHPALLTYGIGNEVNHLYKNYKVWDQINNVAKYIHKVDPNHPTSTVTVGFSDHIKTMVETRAPEIDIMAVNSYGGLEGTIDLVDMAEWDKPFMVTEWGVNGYWEVALTDWEAPIEQSSGQKAKFIHNRYKNIKSREKCLGSFVFLWGFKQERTHTWFNLFLEDGTKTEVVDIMDLAWNGKLPKDRSPHCRGMKLNDFPGPKNAYIKPGKTCSAELDYHDTDGEKMNFRWELYKESTATSTGGDKEVKPEKVNIKFSQKGAKVTFVAPKEKGAYRLFGYVLDPAKNCGYANYPFYVR